MFFTVTTTPTSVGPRIERTISPSPAILNDMIKVTCSVYVDAKPVPNANVEFWAWRPDGALFMGKTDAYTDSRGIAWATFTAKEIGRWRVVVNVPVFAWGEFGWLEVIPQPTVEEPRPVPEGGVNWLLPVGIVAAGALLLLTGRKR